jgi:hypothetical protein
MILPNTSSCILLSTTLRILIIAAALLLPQLLAHIRPRHVDDRHSEEAVAVVLQTSESVVPSQESGKHAKGASGDLQTASGGLMAHAGGVALAREEQEGQVQSEEQGEEGHGRLERAQQQDGGEDEPAGQEETNGRLDIGRVCGVRTIRGGQDLPGLGGLEEGVGCVQLVGRSSHQGNAAN